MNPGLEPNGTHDQEAPAPPAARFLTGDAAVGLMTRAAARSHGAWFTACALAVDGQVQRTNGVRWTATSDTLTILFPRLAKADAGDTLDRIMGEFFRRGLRTASCWATLPSHPSDLGARLIARGFDWGWQPHWMALDLHALDPLPLPSGLEIVIDDDADWDVTDLPHFNRAHIPAWQGAARMHPRRTWHFAARMDGEIVGHSLLHVTTGGLGVGGMYSVGVRPAARRRGIGTAISLAPCLFARALGCRYVVLNSAADFLYTPLGFRHLGYGHAWWLHADARTAFPPSPAEVRFAEAIGRGDIAALGSLRRSHVPGDMDAPLASGMTPMEIAVKMRRPRAVTWLEGRGATLGILDAWDLGWHDRARAVLRERPELVNHQAGERRTTPLHDAVQRDDADLVRLLLAAGPDLSIQDSEFHGTPLGWARALSRPEIATLLERAQDGRG